MDHTCEICGKAAYGVVRGQFMPGLPEPVEELHYICQEVRCELKSLYAMHGWRLERLIA